MNSPERNNEYINKYFLQVKNRGRGWNPPSPALSRVNPNGVLISEKLFSK
jgi:hypothetical protein